MAQEEKTMKKKEWIPVLGGLLVIVLFVAGYFALKQHNEKQEREEATQKALLVFAYEDVTDIEFTDSQGNPIHLQRQGDEWVYLDDTEHCQLVQEAVSNLLMAVNELIVLNQLEDVSSLADYGLEPPVNEVKLTISDEAYSIQIGNYNKTSISQYVTYNGDMSVVYAVDTSLIGIFDVDIFDLVEGENFPSLTSDVIQQVTYKTAGELEDERLTDYSGISTITFNNYVEYYCTDFSKYGLSTPEITINITYLEMVDDQSNVDGDGISGTVSREKKLQLSIGDKYIDEETKVECYYVRMNDSKEVHSIAVEKIDKLLSDKE